MSRTALFLGDSHLSAIKLAAAEFPELKTAPFFCARGGDLRFTELRDGRIVASEGEAVESQLVSRSSPVRVQFLRTGGSETIDLSSIGQIFYVTGHSAFDFWSQGYSTADTPLSEGVWAHVLNKAIGSGFSLAPLIRSIRQTRPDIRHYHVGRPLKYLEAPPADPTTSATVKLNRSKIDALKSSFLFDDIYRPDESVLNTSLLCTREEFCRGGRQESEAFQGEPVTQSDHSHMNKDYGAIVMREFILPAIHGAAG